MKTAYELFLESLGFTDVRQIKTSGVVELYVGQTMKAAKKLLRGKRLRFPLIEKGSIANAQFQKLYAVQDQRVVGQVQILGYTTHTIIQLENLS
jgi:hypothetical protein